MGAGVLGHYEFANQILDIALVVVPAVLGLGAIGSFSYGVISTGRALASQGMGVLKFGASVLGGAVVGGMGGLRAGIGAMRSSEGAVGVKDVVKQAGKEAVRGGVHGAFGSRGLLQTVNRALWSEMVEKELLEKLGGRVSYTAREVGEGGQVKEITVSRPALDKVGKFSTRSERIIYDNSIREEVKQEPEPEPQPSSPIITPDTRPDEWREGIMTVNRMEDVRKRYGTEEAVRWVQGKNTGILTAKR